MPSIKLTSFNGMIPRQQPRNLPKGHSVKAVDVDLSKGTLNPFKTDKKISDKTGNSLFVDKCCVLTSDNCRASYSIMPDCKYIIASGVKKYPVINKRVLACNDEWVRLGLPFELTTPTVYQEFVGAPAPTEYDLHPDNFNLEVRQYYYTVVDIFGFESSPSYPSEAQYFHNDKDVEITDLPTEFT